MYVTTAFFREFFNTPKNILSLDPGRKTTGVAEVLELHKAGFNQANVFLAEVYHKEGTYNGYELLDLIFHKHHWDVVLCEDYRLYGSKNFGKTHQLTMNRLHEVRIIGVITYLAYATNTPLYMPMAQRVKNARYKPIQGTGVQSVHSLDALHHIQYLYNKFVLYANNTCEF